MTTQTPEKPTLATNPNLELTDDANRVQIPFEDQSSPESEVPVSIAEEVGALAVGPEPPAPGSIDQN